MIREPALIVCTPLLDGLTPETQLAIDENIGSIRYTHETTLGLPINEARNVLVDRALRIATDTKLREFEVFVAWVDADCWFPPGTMQRMINALRRMPDTAIVCGHHCVRSELMPACVLTKGLQNKALLSTLSHIPLRSRDYEMGDIVEVGYVGSHFIVHRASFLLELPAYPWSLEQFDYWEDIAFMRRVVATGKKIKMLTACQIAHIGDGGDAFMPYRRKGKIAGNRFVGPRLANTAIDLKASLSLSLRKHPGVIDANQFEAFGNILTSKLAGTPWAVQVAEGLRDAQ